MDQWDKLLSLYKNKMLAEYFDINIGKKIDQNKIIITSCGNKY